MTESDSTRSDDPRIIADFYDRYIADRARDAVRSLAQYQAMFPGHEKLIERQYLSIANGASASSSSPFVEGIDDVEDDMSVEVVGHFRIGERIGKGGQGCVYRAVDERLGREVALKLLPAMFIASDQARKRFKREAEVASKLDHPAICTIHEIGIDSGIAYIAMRLVEGVSLSKIISAVKNDGIHRLPYAAALQDLGLVPGGSADREVRAWLRFFSETARGLHIAHEAGVVHRDVKPGNIMVTPTGAPVILDFGLARDTTEDDHGLTQSGDVFGTPAYMSPEQVDGRCGELDRRTDIYSLAVTMHECLTLKRPFSGATRADLYAAIKTQDPPDPGAVNRGVGRDLATVLYVAMEKDRARRYEDAAAFADDLDRVRTNEPVSVRPVGAFGRLRRWGRRNPVVATFTVALIASLAMGLISTLAALSRATSAEALAEAERDTALERDYVARIKGAAAHLQLADVRSAANLLDACATAQRGWEWRFLRRCCRSSLASLRLEATPLDIAIDAQNGAILAVTNRGMIRWRDDGAEVEVVDRRNRDDVTVLRFCRADWAAWCDSSGAIHCGNRMIARQLDRHTVAVVQPSPDGDVVCVIDSGPRGTRTAVVRLIDAVTGETLARRTLEGGVVTGCCFAPTGDRLAISLGRGDSDLYVLRTRDLQALARHRERGRSIQDVAIRACDGLLFAVSHESRENTSSIVRALDPATGAVLSSLPISPVRSTCLAVDPAGRAVVVGEESGAIRVADGGLGRVRGVLVGHQGAVTELSFAEDGLLVSAGEDATLRLWDPTACEPFERLSRARGETNDIAVSQDGRFAASASLGSPVTTVWDLRDLVPAFELETGPQPAVAFGSDGELVVACAPAGKSKTICRFDAAGALRHAVTIPDRDFLFVAASRDGRRFLQMRTSGSARLVAAADGEVVCECSVKKNRLIGCVAPDGDAIAVLDPEGGIAVIGVGGDSIQRLRAPRGAVSALALRSARGPLAVGLRDGRVAVFEALDTDSRPSILVGHTDWIRALAWHPFESRLATGGNDRKISIWNTATGDQLLSMNSGVGEVGALAWGPRGERLLSGGSDPVVTLFDASVPANDASRIPRSRARGAARLELIAATRSGAARHEVLQRCSSNSAQPTVRELVRAFVRATDSSPLDTLAVLAQPFPGRGVLEALERRDLGRLSPSQRLLLDFRLGRGDVSVEDDADDQLGFVGQIAARFLAARQGDLESLSQAIADARERGFDADAKFHALIMQGEFILESGGCAGLDRLAGLFDRLVLNSRVREVVARQWSGRDRDAALALLDRMRPSYEVLTLLARIVIEDDRADPKALEAALARATRAVELAGEAPEGHLWRGAALVRLGRFAEATDSLRQAVGRARGLYPELLPLALAWLVRAERDHGAARAADRARAELSLLILRDEFLLRDEAIAAVRLLRDLDR